MQSGLIPGCLLEKQSDRLQATLNKAKKWVLVTVLYNLQLVCQNIAEIIYTYIKYIYV